MGKYLVEVDLRLKLIENNRSEVEESDHGLIDCQDDEENKGYRFRSRYPFIIAWVTNKSFAEISCCNYLVIEVSDAQLQTQLAHPRDGKIFRVIEAFDDLTSDEASSVSMPKIKLSALLEKTPQLYVKPKVYDGKKLTFRTDGEEMRAYLKALGDGSMSEGARLLVQWAMNHRPQVEAAIDN